MKSAKCQTVIQPHAAVGHIQRIHGNSIFFREGFPESKINRGVSTQIVPGILQAGLPVRETGTVVNIGRRIGVPREICAARSLDPGNFNFRSCAWAFLELSQTDRAMDFVHLDAGSEWAAWATPYVYLASGNLAQAREAVKSVAKSPYYHRELLVACTQA